MTTPKRNEIIERAKQLWIQNEYQNGCGDLPSINPTEQELIESGFVWQAKCELMRNQDEYKEYLAEELGRNVEDIEEKPKPFEIDIEEALRSGVFICGGKGTTKTNLAKIIADRLLRLGYTVKVLDISRAWLKSSVPFYYEIKGSCKVTNGIYQSIIYDLSRLTPREVKRLIGQLLAQEWNIQLSIPETERKWIVYVFEETQMLTPQGHLRSNEAQHVLRLMTSGRNFKLGYIAITQRPALCDTSVFELCFQRYFARLDGANDKAKVANYIGAKAYDLEKLKLGEFIYDIGSETKWISTEEFRAQEKPIELATS